MGRFHYTTDMSVPFKLWRIGVQELKSVMIKLSSLLSKIFEGFMSYGQGLNARLNLFQKIV